MQTLNTMMTSEIAISDFELDSLNTAIYNKYGYDFSGYEKTSFRRRVQRILSRYHMTNIIDLWRKLLFDPEFFHEMKDEISVGMTEMFRNSDFWQVFQDKVLPAFKDNKQIDIWHAGCATGEEVYSTAIMLNEHNLLKKSFALATDLSDKFIATAAAGYYDNDSLRHYNNSYKLYKKDDTSSLKHYLDQDSDGGSFKEYLRGYATFLQQNLVSGTHYIQKFDIIFCRNVMIYFNDELKRKVLRNFHAALKPGGVLCIGYFDSMPQGFTDHFDYLESSIKAFKKIN